MRKLALGSPPSRGVEAKVDWCIGALKKIETASHDIDPFQIADNFTVSNLTATRSFDADSTTTAEIADVIGTLLSDMKQRGAKRA